MKQIKQNILSTLGGYFNLNKYIYSGTPLERRRDMNNRSLRDLENLNVPEGYSGMALTTVKIKGAKIWNEIPIEIRKIDEIASFKRAVINYLCQQGKSH